MNKKKMVIIVILVVVPIMIGVLVIQLQNTSTMNTSDSNTQKEKSNTHNNGNSNITVTQGEIVTVNHSSIIVQTTSGQSTIILENQTNYKKVITSEKTEILKVGNSISIDGEYIDGTLIAASIREMDIPSNMNEQTRPEMPQGDTSSDTGNEFQPPDMINNKISGEITAIQDNIITVKAMGSQTKTIDIFEAVYESITDASEDDLVAGAKVQIMSTKQTDGTLTARSITIE